MFGRQVTMNLTPQSSADFTRIINNQIIPLLNKQKGFREETTLVSPERSKAIATSFWSTKEDAEIYGRTAYPEVLKTLTTVVDGTPTVETFELATSTAHKLATAQIA